MTLREKLERIMETTHYGISWGKLSTDCGCSFVVRSNHTKSELELFLDGIFDSDHSLVGTISLVDGSWIAIDGHCSVVLRITPVMPIECRPASRRKR